MPTAIANPPGRPQSALGMVDVEPIDDYITAPTHDGRFASVVERNLVFEADGTVYQIRLQRSAQHDYALLNRWSAGKEDWSIVAKRRPSDYGIQGYFPARFDPDAFKDVEDDLIEMAYRFEEGYQRQRRNDGAA